MIRNRILTFIKDRLEREDLCMARDFGLPMPDAEAKEDDMPRIVREELDYDIYAIQQEIEKKREIVKQRATTCIHRSPPIC